MTQKLDVFIIGAGISGIGIACHLSRQCPDKSFGLFEARASFGGTWDLFKYPGIRSDSDMYTFGYSFRPWDKGKDIAPAEDILDYLNSTITDYGLADHIHYHHKVTGAKWSSTDKHWTITVENTQNGLETVYQAGFLVSGMGYYDYDNPHNPTITGEENFQGQIIHPQLWDPATDYTDKRVVIIGSGATAVTLVPAMAEKAAHVTMLQRSPTYMVSRPAASKSNRLLMKLLGKNLGHRFIRWKFRTLQELAIWFAGRYPDTFAKMLKKDADKRLGGKVATDPHFSPRYKPWEQRLCLIPDGDLYTALRDGKASIVTDQIDHITKNGIQLKSGNHLDADLILKATGLKLNVQKGLNLSVDETPIQISDHIFYKSVMLDNIPNFIPVVGYASQSWTLKVDLVGNYLCRLLQKMDQENVKMATPKLDRAHIDPDQLYPCLGRIQSAGYIQRGKDAIPKQLPLDGQFNPAFHVHDQYSKDRQTLEDSPLDDGILTFQ